MLGENPGNNSKVKQNLKRVIRHISGGIRRVIQRGISGKIPRANLEEIRAEISVKISTGIF